MPLILFTGRPSCGKTTRATELKSALEKKIQNSSECPFTSVELINDESLAIAKETYRNLHTEKATRGAQQSAVKRLLSKERIVILDNMNYIKGVRYQLFCEAKALLTNYAVVQVGAPEETCRKWNESRSDPWASDLFDQLNFRYEEPNAMARWDSPLFTIAPDATSIDELAQDIWHHLTESKPKPPNQATVLKPATPTNYLTELERITVDVVNKVKELHSVNPGGTVSVPSSSSSSEKIPITLPLHLSVADLNRTRRNFVMLNKVKQMDIDRIEPMFIDFLEKHWARQDL